MSGCFFLNTVYKVVSSNLRRCVKAGHISWSLGV